MSKIVFELQGGLGNQLFQIAALLNVSKHGNHSIVIDKSHYLRRITREYEIGPIEKILGFKSTNLGSVIYRRFQRVYEENEFEPFLFIPAKEKSYRLKGYFQNTTRIQAECNILAKALSEYFIANNRSRSEWCCEKRHVGIHIRRGDYEQIAVNSENFGVLSDEYFLSAIDDFDPQTNHLIFYSEAEELSILKLLNPRFEFQVSLNSDETALNLLGRMQQNDSFIMSNSSLSWWTATLIKHRNPKAQIITPDTWFRKFSKSNSLISGTWDAKKALWKSNNVE